LETQKAEECKLVINDDDDKNDDDETPQQKWIFAVEDNLRKFCPKAEKFQELLIGLRGSGGMIESQLTMSQFAAMKKKPLSTILKPHGFKASHSAKVYKALKSRLVELQEDIAKMVQRHDDRLIPMNSLITETTIVSLLKCKPGHYFHAQCVSAALAGKNQCPNCTISCGTIIGPQPPGYLFVDHSKKTQCGGYPGSGCIIMRFEFPDGIQTSQHQNPGCAYRRDTRNAYLPNTKEGRGIFCLTRLAFKRKLLFTVGRSLSSQRDNQVIFQSIHLKTQLKGGKEGHGYPDNGYFDRFSDECATKGVVPEMLSEDDRHFIENGF
jgi:deltex-like protein